MKKIDIHMIAQLQELREQKEQIEIREKELSKAILTDSSLIPLLYTWYKEIQRKEIWGEKIRTRKFKKQFIFLILYLYSPETLAGVDKTVKGIRPILAKLLGFKSPAGISNLYSDLFFLYKHYKDFRWEINCLYTYLIDKLKEEGYLPEYIDNKVDSDFELS